jgi:hypothetical protein
MNGEAASRFSTRSARSSSPCSGADAPEHRAVPRRHLTRSEARLKCFHLL